MVQFNFIHAARFAFIIYDFLGNLVAVGDKCLGGCTVAFAELVAVWIGIYITVQRLGAQSYG